MRRQHVWALMRVPAPERAHRIAVPAATATPNRTGVWAIASARCEVRGARCEVQGARLGLFALRTSHFARDRREPRGDPERRMAPNVGTARSLAGDARRG